MAKITNKILIIILACLVVVFFISNLISSNRADGYRLELNNQIALNDTLKKEFEGTYQKLAIEMENDKEILKQLKKTNRDLFDTINKKDERINSLTNIALKWQKMYIEATATDSTSIDSQGVVTSYVKFEERYGPVVVKGMTSTPPPKVSMQLSLDPIGIKVVITQTQDMLWNSRVIISDNYKEYLVADKVEVNVIPIEKNYNAYVAGIGFGYPYGLKGNVGYKYKSHLGVLTLGKGMAGIDYYFLFKRR